MACSRARGGRFASDSLNAASSASPMPYSALNESSVRGAVSHSLMALNMKLMRTSERGSSMTRSMDVIG